jgi:hypothetical protein
MSGRSRQPNPCTNMNHRRANAPVGHCPQCGCVVNGQIRVAACSEPQHAAARRNHSVFCVDCGLQLIVSR